MSTAAATFAETEVVVGGWLSDHKGVNLPNVRLDISPITEKDRGDLAYALDLGIGMVALSFVQTPQDLIEARELIGERAMLVAKLEKPSAVRHLERIVSLTDAVMVARGDLGVELPPEDVPVLQKRIVRACRRAGKPVIVATQMLELMIQAPTPTRAEASDVASAVYEGVDAVMLSAETAAGAYPVEAAAMMERVIVRAEQDTTYQSILHAQETGAGGDQRRCGDGGGARHGRDRRRIGHRHLHHVGRHRPARGARATAGADPGDDAGGSGGPQPEPRLGRPSGASARNWPASAR